VLEGDRLPVGESDPEEVVHRCPRLDLQRRPHCLVGHANRSGDHPRAGDITLAAEVLGKPSDGREIAF
jgi:hypothetical protein